MGAPEKKEEEKEETEMGLLMKILKGAGSNVVKVFPPLWFIFGRPHSSMINRFFKMGPLAAFDQTMAKIHPMWTIPEEKPACPACKGTGKATMFSPCKVCNGS